MIMVYPSYDSENVEALNDRTGWSIELVSTSRLVHTHHHISPLRESFYSSVVASRKGLLSFLHRYRLNIPCSIELTNGKYFFTLCALSFFVMAESIHIHYGRLSPAELKVFILSDIAVFSSKMTWTRNVLRIWVTQHLPYSLPCLTLVLSSFASLDSSYCLDHLLFPQALLSSACPHHSSSRCSPTLRDFSSARSASPVEK